MRRLRHRRLLVIATGLVPLLAGCSHGCSAVGCDSRVSVDLSQAGSRFGAKPVSATLCVDGGCETTKVALTDVQVSRVVSHLQPSGPPDKDTVSVTLTLERDGAVLVSSKADARLTRLAPNGDSCEPVCYSSLLQLVGTDLTAVPLQMDP